MVHQEANYNPQANTPLLSRWRGYEDFILYRMMLQKECAKLEHPINLLCCSTSKCLPSNLHLHQTYIHTTNYNQSHQSNTSQLTSTIPTSRTTPHTTPMTHTNQHFIRILHNLTTRNRFQTSHQTHTTILRFACGIIDSFGKWCIFWTGWIAQCEDTFGGVG